MDTGRHPHRSWPPAGILLAVYGPGDRSSNAKAPHRMVGAGHPFGPRDSGVIFESVVARRARDAAAISPELRPLTADFEELLRCGNMICQSYPKHLCPARTPKRYCSRMKVSELLDEQAITRDSWTVLRNTDPAHVWICELLL